MCSCACDVDALKDFERHDVVQHPETCCAAAAYSVAAEEGPSIKRSAVSVAYVSLSKHKIL